MDNNEIFEVTKIMSNLKNHDFTVQTGQRRGRCGDKSLGKLSSGFKERQQS